MAGGCRAQNSPPHPDRFPLTLTLSPEAGERELMSLPLALNGEKELMWLPLPLHGERELRACPLHLQGERVG